MKLIYRGVAYDYNPDKGAARYPFRRIHTSRSTYELIYRGNTYRVDPNAIPKASVQPVSYELIYRGVTYLVNRNKQGEVIAIAPICKSCNFIRRAFQFLSKNQSRKGLGNGWNGNQNS
jgi:hypothetical protein